MKIGDVMSLLAGAAVGLFLAVLEPSTVLNTLGHNRYLTGFIAFAALGGLGEAVRNRLAGRGYPPWPELLLQALMWGVHGLAAALFYWVINGGVVITQAIGLLPGGGYNLHGNLFLGMLTSVLFTGPLFTSLLVNVSFGPVLLAAQRLGGAAWRLGLKERRRPSLAEASAAADWPDFIRAELTALLLFRIPFMTIVFMLPPDLWLGLAAVGTAVIEGLSGLSRRPLAGPGRPPKRLRTKTGRPQSFRPPRLGHPLAVRPAKGRRRPKRLGKMA